METTRCPNCNAELLISNELKEGQHCRCAECGFKFLLKDSCVESVIVKDKLPNDTPPWTVVLSVSILSPYVVMRVAIEAFAKWNGNPGFGYWFILIAIAFAYFGLFEQLLGGWERKPNADTLRAVRVFTLCAFLVPLLFDCYGISKLPVTTLTTLKAMLFPTVWIFIGIAVGLLFFPQSNQWIRQHEKSNEQSKDNQRVK